MAEIGSHIIYMCIHHPIAIYAKKRGSKMADEICLIHGRTKRYDMRSGFDICDECEAAEHVKQATQPVCGREVSRFAGVPLLCTLPVDHEGFCTTAPRPLVDANEEQRRSFAFGNCNIGNPNVTRALVDEEAEKGQPPTIEEIGLGDVAWGIAKRAIDEKWDDGKLGQAVAQFAIAVRAQGLHGTGER